MTFPTVPDAMRHAELAASTCCARSRRAPASLTNCLTGDLRRQITVRRKVRARSVQAPLQSDPRNVAGRCACCGRSGNGFVTLEILSGRLHAPDFERDPSPYFAGQIFVPAMGGARPVPGSASRHRIGGRGHPLAAGNHRVAWPRSSRTLTTEIAADTFTPRVAAANIPTIGEPKCCMTIVC